MHLLTMTLTIPVDDAAAEAIKQAAAAGKLAEHCHELYSTAEAQVDWPVGEISLIQDADGDRPVVVATESKFTTRPLRDIPLSLELLKFAPKPHRAISELQAKIMAIENCVSLIYTDIKSTVTAVECRTRLERQFESLRPLLVTLRDMEDLSRSVPSLVKDVEDWTKAYEQSKRMRDGLYTQIVNRMEPYYDKGDRGLEWDVLPNTIAVLCQSRQLYALSLFNLMQMLRDRGASEPNSPELQAAINCFNGNLLTPIVLHSTVPTYFGDGETTGFHPPREKFGVKVDDGIEVTLNADADSPIDVYIERRPERWVINVSPDSQEVMVSVRVSDNGACDVLDHSGTTRIDYNRLR